jgi:hypothetical protein
VLVKLRAGFAANGMSDKQLGFTTRYNSFWNPAPSGWTPWPSDGEGIKINQYLQPLGTSISEVADWVNIMIYDQPPDQMGSPGGISLETFKTVITHV